MLRDPGHCLKHYSMFKDKKSLVSGVQSDGSSLFWLRATSPFPKVHVSSHNASGFNRVCSQLFRGILIDRILLKS